MFDLVIFDCDGVLVDSEVLSAEAEAEAFAACGIPMSAEDILTSLVGLSEGAMCDWVEEYYGIRPTETFFTLYRQRREELFAHSLAPCLGVADAIAALDVPVCVASNSPVHRIAHSLSVTGLASLFGRHVYSADHVSRPKPAPDLFLHAAAQFGVSPARCLVIEDSPLGAIAARMAGMTCFGYCGASHIRDGHEEKLLRQGVSATFRDMAELNRIIATHTDMTALQASA
ncbi:HAD family hydrolase [Telmatospirillum sp. J64-1]|uniref:HAD family hydrolase n=1 Tax=Telmatospirillum sp. J64-1 TaxID=2502183 RepID=UPI00115E48A4|nr:HAD family hydrolase [Telmatospirillum sp. J64-1]